MYFRSAANALIKINASYDMRQVRNLYGHIKLFDQLEFYLVG
jgi:hypothetical protein